MLSNKSKYALRAMMMLAEPAHANQYLLISDIAQRESIPRKFLEAILVDLRNEGLLSSRRGKLGGYRLARAPEEISVGDIVRVLDGPLAPIRCASRTQFVPCDDCTDTFACRTRAIMLQVRDAIADVLDNCTLATALHQPERVLPLRVTISNPSDTVRGGHLRRPAVVG
ncbi:MAG TPA: Rrf2 family transcriptional regulator [Azospirillum sp.]|nr:Rrf2 family transcriptional regulator [Azospirillum sp.]